MKQVDSANILGRLHAREARGHHIDGRLIQAVKDHGNLFLLTLDDEQSFLSLIWQEIDATRLLTPRGQPRTVGDVAGRMLEHSWTFSSLRQSVGLPPTQHLPSEFELFERINSVFDFAEFDFVAVMAANDSERRQSPNGTFYMYDGVHRTLVFAHRILTKQSHYQPVEVLLITPRRD